MAQGNGRRPLSQEERRRLEKQRKQAAKDARKYHSEREKQEKRAEKSSAKTNTNNKQIAKKTTHSKIEQRVNERPASQREKLTREERFIRDSERKIRNMEPQAYDDGYYIDEYGEREKQQRRAKVIREQENEVIKRRKKPLTSKQVKRRRIIASVLTCLIVLVIGLTLCFTVLFKTEKIVVEGNKYYYDDQVVAFSGVSLQQNIFIARIFGKSDEIVSNLPYIEEAKIVFTVPDTVTIKVTNAVPSYVIKNGDKYLLISGKGRILDEIAENSDKLPELASDDLKTAEKGEYVSFTDDNVPEILEQIVNCLHENGFENITGFDVRDTAMIKIVYDNRITVVIGLPEDIDYKIRTAMSIINEKLDPNNSGTVAGTLDVSACNTTKISRYNPNETVAPTDASTSPTETSDSSAEETTAAEDYYDNYSFESSDGGYDLPDEGAEDYFNYDNEDNQDADTYGNEDNNGE